MVLSMPDPPETIQFVADRGDARLRLDQVLVRRIRYNTRMSRHVAQQWIGAGAVSVDGQVARRPAARVREGAAVEVALPPTAARRATPEPEAIDLQVLYEDDAFIAINKPAGVVVHPSYKQLTGTLLNAVLWRMRDRPGVRPGILTRLDKETSGIVIVALRPQVHAAMQRQSASGLIRKEYLALVRGTPRPTRDSIREPLGRDPGDRRRVIVTPGGAPSETRYQVVAAGTALSLVRCELVTGRTHQIRVHLSSRGWPILGDRVYGGGDEIPRQALHAWRMVLPHPVTSAELLIEAPVPDDMQHVIDQKLTL